MSHMQGGQWSESEKIALLVEVLRDARVDPVFALTRGLPPGYRPNWENIPLPQGRALGACRFVFDDLCREYYHSQTLRQPVVQQQQLYHPVPTVSAPALPAKRSYLESEGVTTPTQYPTLQPRPPFNSASPIGPHAEAPRSTSFDSTEATKKKPGRPTNKEIARREAEAAARGERYVRPQRKPKNKPLKPPELSASPLPMPEPTAGPSNAPPPDDWSESVETPTHPTSEPQRESSSGKRKRRRTDEHSLGTPTTASASVDPTRPVAQSPSDRLRPEARFAPKSTSATSRPKTSDGSEIPDSEVKIVNKDARMSQLRIL